MENTGKSKCRCTSCRNIVPIYIMRILKSGSGREHHMTQEAIRKQLSDEFGYEISLRALGRYINLLVDEELHVFGNTKAGYWYDENGFLCMK